jgi:hypoxanthine phosphoribosyltransferase
MEPIKNSDALQDAVETYRNAERVITPAEIEAAIDKMAEAITARIGDRNPLILSVMVGGMIPAGMLLPKLNFPLQVDYLHVTRYRGDTAGGTLRWFKHPDIPLRDRTVLIIDDVLDEGVTLGAIVDACRTEGPREILTAVLVEKRLSHRQGLLKADFVGVQADNRYLFGYGMDYKNYLRNANGIYAVKS